MQTAAQAKDPKLHNLRLEDKDSLIQHARGITRERSRMEALRLNEEITARQAILASVEPAERTRALQYLKTPGGEMAVGPKPDRYLPPITCVDYQVQRPPYATYYAVPDSVQDVSWRSSVSGGVVSIKGWSAEANAAAGALSIEAAIGEFFNAACDATEPWFIGEANRAEASMAFVRQSGVVLPTPPLLLISADFILEGAPSAWTYYMFPGEPSSGLGLVGFMGIATMALYGRTDSGFIIQDTYERFLLGSASATFPGEVDRKPSFTLSEAMVLPASSTPISYGLILSAELTAFRSIPIQNGGYPGYAQAKLTLPGTGAALGPSTPLKVTEIRASICTL